MNYLYAAYAVTWVIHIGYLTTIVLRYTRLRDELRDLKNDR
jgi:CcmD family protein